MTEAMELMALAGTGTGLALLVCWWTLTRGRPAVAQEDTPACVFVTEAGRVIDATADARTMLDMLGEDAWKEDRLISWLSASFPDLPAALETLPERHRVMVDGSDGSARLEIVLDGERRRIAFLPQPEAAATPFDAVSAGELSALRAIAEAVPCPVWQQDASGRIAWVNRAYLVLSDRETGTRTWPPQPLFGSEDFAGDAPRRLKLGEDWFDCRAVNGAGGRIVTALPATDLARAEQALEDFRGTVARTFAHLTVGLAIFDRNGCLVVFNPALGDLTGLPVDMMLSRPSFASFLDALRARRMIPEPRDYGSWRERVAALEGAAREGTFSELWHLSGGRTFRVTGRPQPDGACALLIEDVSAEVSLTRRFRAEIEIGHAVIDALPDAVAVFDRAGTMILTNATYDRLWNVETRETPGPFSTQDAIGHWQDAGTTGPALEDLAAALAAPDRAHGFTGELTLAGGRAIGVHLVPLPGASLMLRFTSHAPVAGHLMRPRDHAPVTVPREMQSA